MPVIGVFPISSGSKNISYVKEPPRFYANSFINILSVMFWFYSYLNV